VTLGSLVVPALEIGINDLVVPGDDSQLGFVFQAAAVRGVLNTLAAAST